VYYRPGSIEAARLVSVRNFVPGDVADVVDGRAVVRTPWFTAQAASGRHKAGDAVYVCIRPEHAIVLRDGASAHDPRDTVVSARIVDDAAHPLFHSLSMLLQAAGETGVPFPLEVDVPSHPYAVLGLAAGACRNVVLPFAELFLVARS
jgi:hypothetical protein